MSDTFINVARASSFATNIKFMEHKIQQFKHTLEYPSPYKYICPKCDDTIVTECECKLCICVLNEYTIQCNVYNYCGWSI